VGVAILSPPTKLPNICPLRSIPSLLEYFSYAFNFHSILIGPGYTIREHLAFIDGSNLTPLDNPNQFARAKEHSKEPSTLIPVAKKFLLSLIYMAAYLSLGNYPHRTILDESFNVPYRLLMILVVAMRVKLGFHFIWTLSDCVNNAAGLGFSGYDAHGNAVWDLTTNLDFLKFELAMNPRIIANEWNITTARWLRRVSYDRITWQRAHMTFLLSAFWHGFYPSYYLGLIYLGFLNETAKKMWRLLNPFFTSNGWALRWTYHLVTWFFSHIFANYGSLAVQLHWLQDVFVYWKTLYFIPLVTCVIITVFAPSGRSSRQSSKEGGEVATGNENRPKEAKSMKQD
jgi:lysophospholipid acyltransferase 1/2